MVEFYLLTFPRVPLRKKEHKSYFGKNRTHDFRTSRCAAYLLDHSGDAVRKKSSVGYDRPLSLICLLRSSSFSEAGPQVLLSVLTSVHGPACVLLVVVPGPSPPCSLRVTTTPSSFVMHSGSSLGFFLERKAQPDLPPVDNRFSILPPSPAYIPGALPRIEVHTSFRHCMPD